MAMDQKALEAFIRNEFPQVGSDFRVETIADDHIIVRLIVSERHLRPGGTVSGPAMFALADISAYFMILSRIGPKALSVTTNASLDFLRKPAANCDLIANCRLLKMGKALVVCDALLYSEGSDAPVARANLTYSIPPEK